MNGFLLDTNTVSELVSIKPHQRVLDWMEAADENRLFLSVMTLGEIRQGVTALPRSKKRARLETWLEVDLQSRFAGRILAIDGAVANRWGWIMAQAHVKGLTLPVVDSLLAATALHHSLTPLPAMSATLPWLDSASSTLGRPDGLQRQAISPDRS